VVGVVVGVVGSPLSLDGGVTMKLIGETEGSNVGSCESLGLGLAAGDIVTSVGSSVGDRVEGAIVGISCGGVGNAVGGRVGRGVEVDVVGDGGVDDGGLVDGAGVVVSCDTGPSGAIPPRSQFHSAGGAVDSSHPV
jgi:hypothetical protein